MNAALEWIWTDLTRPKNDESWASLAEIDPRRSRIELFDMVWWVYFRLQPVQRQSHPYGRAVRAGQAMAHRANKIAYALVRDQTGYDPDRWA